MVLLDDETWSSLPFDGRRATNDDETKLPSAPQSTRTTAGCPATLPASLMRTLPGVVSW
jgi:hypothetical protein